MGWRAASGNDARSIELLGSDSFVLSELLFVPSWVAM
jgi:hypothetical protein